MAKNIEYKLDGDKLTVTIDLSKSFGLSKSGKTIVVATTEGNVPVREGLFLGVNCYKFKEKTGFNNAG